MILHQTEAGTRSRFGKWLFTTDVILFLSLWLVYGLAINSSNLEEFGVQQSGVEAIVERWARGEIGTAQMRELVRQLYGVP